MGETAQVEIYHDYDVDRPKDWGELIEVVPAPPSLPIPPLPPKHVQKPFKNVLSVNQQTVQMEAQPPAQNQHIANLSHCHFCQKPFEQRRRNQKFCNPDIERGLNFQRRKALIVAVAEQFRQLGLSAADMLAVAKRCVDAAYEWFLGAMQKIGWEYSHADRAWRHTKNS